MDPEKNSPGTCANFEWCVLPFLTLLGQPGDLKKSENDQEMGRFLGHWESMVYVDLLYSRSTASQGQALRGALWQRHCFEVYSDCKQKLAILPGI